MKGQKLKDLFGELPEHKLTPEQKAEYKEWIAEQEHPRNYFELEKAEGKLPFPLLPIEVAEVESILKEQMIVLPDKLREGLFWIAGFLKYRFERKTLLADKKRWDIEREYYQKKETREGVDFYFRMQSMLPDWEAIKSITFEVKPGFTYGGIPEKSVKVSYPEMIRFIVDAMQEKRESRHELVNKGQFFHDESDRVDKYNSNDEWYRTEVEMNNFLDPKWREQQNKQLKKYRRTPKSLSNYLALQNKKIIEGLYSYLTDKTNFKQAQKIKVIAGLFYFADVPDEKGKRKKNTDALGSLLMEVHLRVKQYVNYYEMEPEKVVKHKKGMKG